MYIDVMITQNRLCSEPLWARYSSEESLSPGVVFLQPAAGLTPAGSRRGSAHTLTPGGPGSGQHTYTPGSRRGSAVGSASDYRRGSKGSIASTISVPDKNKSILYQVWTKISTAVHKSERSQSLYDLPVEVDQPVPTASLPQVNDLPPPRTSQPRNAQPTSGAGGTDQVTTGHRHSGHRDRAVRRTAHVDPAKAGLFVWPESGHRKRECSSHFSTDTASSAEGRSPDMDITVLVSPPRSSESPITPSPPNALDANPHPSTDSTGTKTDSVMVVNQGTRRRRTKKSGNQRTIQAVTDEARIVLEQILKRSLSHNDASPLKHRSMIEQIPGDHQHQNYGDRPHGRHTVIGGSNSYGAVCRDHVGIRYIDDSFEDGDEQEDMLDGQLGIDDDAESSHSPVSKTTSVYSGSSRSSSFVNRMHQIDSRVGPSDVEAALNRARDGISQKQQQQQQRRSLRRRRKSSHKKDPNSSSSSDQSDTENSDNGPRRKKTLFKRATERVRESLRQIREREKLADPQQLAEAAQIKGRPSSIISQQQQHRPGSVISQTQSLKAKTSNDMSPSVVVASFSDNGSLILNTPSSDKRSSLGSKVGKSTSRRTSKKSKPQQHEKENYKNIFDNLLKSIRKRKKPSKESNISGTPLSPDGHQNHSGAAASVAADGDVVPLRPHAIDLYQPPVEEAISDLAVLGAGRVDRAGLQLPGLVKNTPSSGGTLSHDSSQAAVSDWLIEQRRCASHHRRESTVLEGDIIDNWPPHTTVGAVTGRVDDKYDHYADQLAYIAETGRLSPTVEAELMTGGGWEGAVADTVDNLHVPECKQASRTPSLERKIAEILRESGDRVNETDPTLMPVIRDMVRDHSYTHFSQIVSDNVERSVGQEPSWQQVALVFKLSQSAIRFAGMSSNAAKNLKEMTLRYFEDRFAGWIVGQGGWESMVEDTSVDDELD